MKLESKPDVEQVSMRRRRRPRGSAGPEPVIATVVQRRFQRLCLLGLVIHSGALQTTCLPSWLLQKWVAGCWGHPRRGHGLPLSSHLTNYMGQRIKMLQERDDDSLL